MIGVASVLTLYVSVTLAVMFASPLRPKLTGWRRRAAFVWVICMAVAQALANPRLTYPFIPWNMYDGIGYHTEFAEFIVNEGKSDTHDYAFEALAPWSPGPFHGYSNLIPLSERLLAAQHRCGCLRDDDDLDSLIRALAKYDAVVTKRPVETFDVYITRLGPNGRRGHIYHWEAVE